MNSGVTAGAAESVAVEGDWMDAGDSAAAATSTGEDWAAPPAGGW